MKKLLAIIVAATMSLTLASSCARTQGTSAAAAKKNIFVIIKGLGNAYWAILQAGATDAGKDLDCNVTIQGIPNEVDIEVQLGFLQNAVSARADAIVIAVADSEAEANAVSEAYKSGIPIVLVDTKANTEDYSAALLTNNVEAGKLAAEELLKKMRNKLSDSEPADIAMQIGSTGSQTIKLRMEGFRDYWAANAPADWKLLDNDVKVNDGDITKAIQFGHDFLTAYPNLKGFFSPNNGSTVGFATALKEANRSDITMVGFDFSAEMEEIIRDNSYNVSTMLQRQYVMGYDGVKIAMDLANGGKVTEKDIDTGVMAVDFSNVDSDAVKAAAGIK
ncbi:MAG: ABC transporter substrate-binding protein [Clostridiales bacterium]|jgi:ribose transport system substrate-binding protein|nr:ABC transporter substrate-binding protein [Clostridiales bacterium]